LHTQIEICKRDGRATTDFLWQPHRRPGVNHGLHQTKNVSKKVGGSTSETDVYLHSWTTPSGPLTQPEPPKSHQPGYQPP
jgi:hypothetical protein